MVDMGDDTEIAYVFHCIQVPLRLLGPASSLYRISGDHQMEPFRETTHEEYWAGLKKDNMEAEKVTEYFICLQGCRTGDARGI